MILGLRASLHVLRIFVDGDLGVVLKSIEQRLAHDLQLDLHTHAPLSGVERDHVMQQLFESDVPENFVARSLLQQCLRCGLRIGTLLNNFLHVVPCRLSDASVLKERLTLPHD